MYLIYIAIDYFMLQENFEFVLSKTGFDQSIQDSIKSYCESLGVTINLITDLSTINCVNCVVIINKYDNNVLPSSHTGPVVFITQPTSSPSISYDYYYLSLTGDANKNQYEVIMYIIYKILNNYNYNIKIVKIL